MLIKESLYTDDLKSLTVFCCHSIETGIYFPSKARIMIMGVS